MQILVTATFCLYCYFEVGLLHPLKTNNDCSEKVLGKVWLLGCTVVFGVIVLTHQARHPLQTKDEKMATTTKIERTATFTKNLLFRGYDVSFKEDGVTIDKKLVGTVELAEKAVTAWSKQ